ncbi:MAG: hypothetical protein A2719_01245 [Candidatus Ryanbacteria bacterium RIFCSPHIGHO2_01_FULL_45_22]|uniref:Baseplate protein J-like domain-containing protein n=2 Tax=Candidatus Ryaniibacteriota TaxID=1817914 RepID=A0A1G2G1G3_9BACT|nr:MAG: hypothetical protein A2719_01245 [Candidatus Ryanbacteria bacterium RIFCSPHIGHO2_01_FULL_45_22]OGZ46353.1 MAG: hypothetical protein A3J54_04130 [Candidatus Ryanbacteria bacterium RIFCSPHIGHO2_02_FULL_45_13b]
MPEKSDQNSQHIPLRTDPASGQFIVADILPPRSTDIYTVASRSGSPKKQKSAHEIPIRTLSKKNPLKEPGNTHAVDAWFRKESVLRDNRSIPGSFSAGIPGSFRKKRTFLIWFALVLVLAAGGYSVSYAMSRLEITITMKTQSHDVDQKISIAVKPTHADALAGERVEVSDSASATFQATGTADVNSKAKGTLSVYNAFNTSPQLLIANTRFETPDGKIYRTKEAITIPPAVLEHGVLSPRSIDIVVYADASGPAYNHDLTDFTIPGFKGSPRYTGFYARSKTPIEGGYVGVATVVTEKDLDKARESLESEARSRVIDALKKSIPEGFVLLDDAIEITTDKRKFSHAADEVANEFSATMTLRARALVFRKNDLAQFFTKEASLDPSLVSLPRIDEITLAVERRNVETGTLLLHAKGTAFFVWNLDTNKLIAELAQSKNPDMFPSIFQQYPAIERAEPRFIPSWIRAIPHDPADIQIVTNI